VSEGLKHAGPFFNTTPEESTAMERSHPVLAAWLTLGAVSGLCAAEPKAGESPADHLPPHINRVTWFGERADWSHDGKRLLFLSTGYKASNPVVSDDGRFMTFQMATSREAAGVGHGIFVFDIDKASVGHH
jgi:hypothetical protein